MEKNLNPWHLTEEQKARKRKTLQPDLKTKLYLNLIAYIHRILKTPTDTRVQIETISLKR
ncbi:MAG: hypothetical protein WC741_05110 [Patescibacteria group bacterium]|jgi:hypothetical protein